MMTHIYTKWMILMGLFFIFPLRIAIATQNNDGRTSNSADNKPKFNNEGLFIEDGELKNVRSDFFYDELKITKDIRKISKEKKARTFYTKDGEEKDKEVNIFNGVHIKTLVFEDDCKLEELDTQCLTGVKDLEIIRFEGNIPNIKEEHSLWCWGEDDWRENLKLVVVQKDAEVSKLSFAGDIRAIRFGVEGKPVDASLKTVIQNDKDGKLLRGCSSLKRVLIPYELAETKGIEWTCILKTTKLNEAEVISLPNERGERILVQSDSSSSKIEISEGVTYIHGDAFKPTVKEVVLPISFRGFLFKKPENNITFVLKNETVTFSPAINDFRLNRISQKSQSSEDNNKDFLDDNRLFPRTRQAAKLMIMSAYPQLNATIRKNSYPALEYSVENAIQRGLGWELTKEIAMGFQYELSLILNIVCKDTMGESRCSLPVQMNLNGVKRDKLKFATPREKPWLGMSFLLLILFFALYLGSLWFIRRFTPKGCMLQKIAYACLVAPWYKQLPFLFAILLLVLGSQGVLSDLMTYYVWMPVNMYLNASFISSLIISLTTTGLKIGLGFLQGITVGVFGVEIDFAHVLEPVLDMLGRIEGFSWLATLVLVFLRILSELAKNLGVAVWTLLGMLFVVKSFPGTRIKLSEMNVWFERAFQILCMLALGFPLLLWIASWISTEMMTIAGNTFNDALISFKLFVENVTLKSLFSLEALETLASQLTTACVELITASFTYLALKAFDCGVVPLGILFGILYVAKKWEIKGADVSLNELAMRTQKTLSRVESKIIALAAGTSKELKNVKPLSDSPEALEVNEQEHKVNSLMKD